MDSVTGLVSEKIPGAVHEKRWMDSQTIFLAALEFHQILSTDTDPRQTYEDVTVKAVEQFHNKYGPLSGPWIDEDPRACNFFGLAGEIIGIMEKPLVSNLELPIKEVPNKKGELIPSIVPVFLWQAIVLAYKFPDAEFRTCQYRINHGGPRNRGKGLCPPKCLIPRKQKWGDGCNEHNRKIERGLTTHRRIE